MEYSGGKNKHFRHLLFFAFHRGHKAAEVVLDVCRNFITWITNRSRKCDKHYIFKVLIETSSSNILLLIFLR
ncbi:hypothetical protein K1T71_012066 [Dendrolimus kikuchii]|uniref:Uncharacterized protein n=1 Tax=Dendrolimus kikuchii TaxID=765133 RepID=A0ACC1CKM4_9NEOP|nr:hypothetical protein K1T71_012066 [Dendrolimus kikuchii]